MLLGGNYLTPFQFQGFSQNTFDDTSISGLGTGSKWAGGVLAPNGKIYGIPRDSTSVLIIDPVAGTADTTTITGLSDQPAKWTGGVLAPNGKIYGIPRNSSSVLIIDPETNTVDTTTILVPDGNGKWHGGVLALNGKIYGIPYVNVNFSSVLIIDPETNTVDYTTITVGTGFGGGVLGPDGKIYGIPYANGASNVCIIDPATNTADTTSIKGLNLISEKWFGGALGPDGKIYGAPHGYGDYNLAVLIIDPYSSVVNIESSYGININTASYDDSTKTLNCPLATLTSGLTIGDNIIITTASDSYTGYIQSLTNTTLLFIFGLGVNIPNGSITGLSKTRKADITTIQGFYTADYSNVGMVTAQNGKMYGIPWYSNNILIVDPNSPVVNITNLYGITVGNVTYTSSTQKLTCSGATLTSGLTIGDNIIITTATKTYTGYIQSLTNTELTFVNPIVDVNINAGQISKLEKTRKADITTMTGVFSAAYAGGVVAPNGIIYGMPDSSGSVLQIKSGLPTLPPWMLEAYFNKF